MNQSHQGLNAACFLAPPLALVGLWNTIGTDDPFPLVAGSSWLIFVLASIGVWVFSRSPLLKSAAKATVWSCGILFVAMLLIVGFFVWAFRGVDGPTGI